MIIKPSQPVTIRNLPTRKLTIGFYQRLIAFYHLQKKRDVNLSIIWGNVSSFHHNKVVEALDGRNPERLEFVLSDLYAGCTIYGLDSSLGSLKHLNGATSPEHERSYIHNSLELLLQLANSLGVYPVSNPEQPTNDEFDPVTVINSIESELGCHLTHPGFANLCGLVIGDRFLPHKLIDAALVVSLLQRKTNDAKKNLLLEIGGGIGWVPYLCHQIEFGRYYSVDLPIVSIFQAVMLAAAASEDQVWLYGEPPSPAAWFHLYGLYGYDLDQPIHLAINQDSFPEIIPNNQSLLLKMLSRCLICGGRFLSINQESSVTEQHRVYSAVKEFPQFRLRERSPYWGRQGYVTEVYEKL